MSSKAVITPLTRQEAKAAKPKTKKPPKRRRAPKKPKRERRSAIPNTFIPWSDKEDGKNVQVDYIAPDDVFRVNPMLETAYKAVLEMNRKISFRIYNTIQMARLHFNKYGEVPFDLNDLMRGD